MGIRDILAQLMSGGTQQRQPLSFEELLRQENGDRDTAAKRFNAQQGGPVSSAYSPPAAVAPDPMQTAAVPLPAQAPIPTAAPARLPENAPIPMPRPTTQFPPDLAVSPPRDVMPQPTLPEPRPARKPSKVKVAKRASQYGVR